MDTFPAAALPLLSAVVAAVLPLSVEAVAAGSLEEPHAVRRSWRMPLTGIKLSFSLI